MRKYLATNNSKDNLFVVVEAKSDDFEEKRNSKFNFKVIAFIDGFYIPEKYEYSLDMFCMKDVFSEVMKQYNKYGFDNFNIAINND